MSLRIQYLEETIPCSECDGTGTVEIIDRMRINCRTIDVPYKTIECEACGGNGYVEIEEEEENE